jgi:hypothetical protein
VTADYNGYNDEREEEREALDVFDDLGKYDEFEGWPEGSVGPEYWLMKGIHRDYRGDE